MRSYILISNITSLYCNSEISLITESESETGLLPSGLFLFWFKFRPKITQCTFKYSIMTNGRASYTLILCHELIPENRSSWKWTILLFNLIFGIGGALPWRMRSSPLVARSSCGITERSPLTADWRSAFYTFTAEPHLTVPFVQTDPGRRREPGSCEVTSHL